MSENDQTSAIGTPNFHNSAVPPPPTLAEVLSYATLVVVGTVERDHSGGRRLRVTERLLGDEGDMELLAQLPVPEAWSDSDEIVLLVAEGDAPGPAEGRVAPQVLVDPRYVDKRQLVRVLAGLPPLAPIDGSPDDLLEVADLVLIGGPTGASRPLSGSSCNTNFVAVEMQVREVLSARPDALERAGLSSSPIGVALPVGDRPHLWVEVEATEADRFCRSIPGLWFVSQHEGRELRSITRSIPEQFLGVLRPLRTRLRPSASGPDA